VFGEGAGVRFVDNNGSLLDSAQVWPSAPNVRIVEGGGVWCDSVRGQLRFWTTPGGIQSANGFGSTAPAATEVGTSSTQGALLIPWRADFYGQNLVYALLVPDRTSNTTRLDPLLDVSRSAVIDLDPPRPVVQPTRVFSGSYATERVCGSRTPDSSGYLLYTIADDSMLIVRNESVMPDGVPSSSAFSLGRRFGTFGQMKVNRSGTRLAICDGNLHLVGVNPANGRPSGIETIRLLDLPALRSGQADMYAYGSAWASGERFLYVTVRLRIEDGFHYAALVQLDTRAGNAMAISQSAVLIDTVRVTESTPPALQLGPDGRIYMPNGRYLCVVRRPDRAGVRCSYVANHVDLSPARSRSGLPSCIENDFAPPPDPLGVLRRIYACESDSVVIVADSLRGDYSRYEVVIPGVLANPIVNTPRIVLSDIPAGTYRATLRLFGVDTVVEVYADVVVDAAPVITTAADTIWICSGDVVGVRVQGADSYTFAVNGSSSQRIGTDSIYLGTVFGRADVTVVGFIGDCQTVRTIPVRVRPSGASINPDTVVCFGSTATLSVKGALAVRWLDTEAGTDVNALQRTVRPQSTSMYRVVVESALCPDTLVTTVVVLPLPRIETVKPIATCPGDSVLLWVLGGDVHEWWVGDSLVAVGDTVRVVPNGPTTYTVRARTVAGCESRLDVPVDIRDNYTVPLDIGSLRLIPGNQGSVTITVEPDGLGHRYGIIVPKPYVDVLAFEGATEDERRAGVSADTIVVRLMTVPSAGKTSFSMVVRIWFGSPVPLQISGILVGVDGCAARVGVNGQLEPEVCGGPLRSIRWHQGVNVTVQGGVLHVDYDSEHEAIVNMYDMLGKRIDLQWRGGAGAQYAPVNAWSTPVVVVVSYRGVTASRLILL